ncbi:MAG: acyl carrier protein [Paludibacteraceae bacterium]|nr:acyl carrier protein [Paludibacteraceae bacterium]
MMFKSEMATKVKQIIVDKLNIPESEVTLNTNITKDLGASPFEVAQLMTVFEKEFGVTFSNEQATSIVSVGDFLPIIETNLCVK